MAKHTVAWHVQTKRTWFPQTQVQIQQSSPLPAA